MALEKYVREIERWLQKTGIKESRLGLEAAANQRAVGRIRDGSARLDTLEAVLRFIRQNRPQRKRAKRSSTSSKTRAAS